MKVLALILSALLVTQFSQAVTLVEFDAEESNVGTPSIEIKSMEIWISPDAKKIAEDVYQEKGGCSACDFINASVRYNMIIPLGGSIKLRLPMAAHVWGATTSYSGGEKIKIPSHIMSKDLNHPDVAKAVGGHAQYTLNYIATVRRKTPVYNKEQRKCFQNSFRGTYSPSDYIVRSYNQVQYLVGCP